MIVEVSKTFRFHAAHRLLDYEGKCANVHGHTWHVEVTFTSGVHLNGISLDFNEIEKLVKPIIKKFDHADLNEVFKDLSPTAENIAGFIKTSIMMSKTHQTWKSDTEKNGFDYPRLSKITVWETPENKVVLRNYPQIK